LQRRDKLFTVNYYEMPDGTFPAEEFILSQDVKMKAKLFKMLELLELFGNELREPFSKHLRDGLLEIRAIQGNNIARILYFFVDGRNVILTHGFTKKTQTTPEAEINRAKKYKNAYQERKAKKNG